MEAKQPTQEQIKEFWEWCGFRWEGEDEVGKGFWLSPDGYAYCYPNNHLTSTELLPFIDLNNLFKYAVPRLQDRGHQVELLAFEHKGFRATVYKECFSRRGSDGYDPCLEPITQQDSEDPALALFWAIWEVKDG